MKDTNLIHKYRKRSFLFILFLAFIISCTQKTEKPKVVETVHPSIKVKTSDSVIVKETHPLTEVDTPTFLVYGMVSPAELDNKYKTALKRFGFKTKRVGGCLVTGELTDSVRIINQKNDLIMQSKYGKDWKQKFEKKTKLNLGIPDI